MQTGNVSAFCILLFSCRAQDAEHRTVYSANILHSAFGIRHSGAVGTCYVCPNASRSTARLFGTAVSGGSLPSISSDTHPWKFAFRRMPAMRR
jgi:hypothetical protein